MLQPEKRPKAIAGVTTRYALGCGNLYVTVNSKDGQAFEVFATLGKAGGCPQAMLEAICRMVSVVLRAGVDAQVIVKHLRGVQCPQSAWEDGEQLLSCPDCIGRALEAQP